MLISVIIPAFQASKTLGRSLRAIQSARDHARSSGLDLSVEALVAVDDTAPRSSGWSNADAYRPLQSAFDFLRLVLGGDGQTGPSRTRNRAMAVAKGEFFAVMDSDDSWSANYLSHLFPLAHRHGAAFARTKVLIDGKGPVDQLGSLTTFPFDGDTGADEAPNLGDGKDGKGGKDGDRSNPDQVSDDKDRLDVTGLTAFMTLDMLGKYGGSFHPLVHKSLIERNVLARAQDVWSAAICIAKHGRGEWQGGLPLATQAYYHLHLRDGSMTTATHYAQDIDQAYGHLARLSATHATIPSGKRDAMARLWQTKAQQNREFIRLQQERQTQGHGPWPSFYHWRHAALLNQQSEGKQSDYQKADGKQSDGR